MGTFVDYFKYRFSRLLLTQAAFLYVLGSQKYKSKKNK